ncbi:MAG: glycosyltransferase family 2 protein [Candidatus Longimicrobiales bacterium M2_2A_002]
MRRRPHYPILFAIGVLAALALGAVLVVGVVVIIEAPLELRSVATRTIAVVMLVFLAILLLRYGSLIWLAYLHTAEQTVRSQRQRDGHGTYLPPVSIVLPAYNEGRVIEAAIRSLLRLDYPRYEVIVIDDGSTDETAKLASAFEGQFDTVRVRVYSKLNGGKASALNMGLRMADYPFVVTMDGDSLLEPNALRDSMHHFLRDDVGAVAGNVKVGNRKNLLTRLQALEYIEGLNIPRRAQAVMRAVNIVPGPIGIFRRSVLLEVGGYDSDTFAEDTDLTLKILSAGWRVVYEERAVALTEAPETLEALIRQRYRWTRGILQALDKHRGLIKDRDTDPASRFSIINLLFEILVWPAFNILGHLGFAFVALGYGMPATVVAWWLLITVLEIAVALLSVAVEEESLALVPMAVVYRFFYMFVVDVVKLFASLEEFLKLEMTWGKLERTGSVQET